VGRLVVEVVIEFVCGYKGKGRKGERDVRYAMSIQAFSTSSVVPTYFEELRGLGRENFTRE
jgi:hypothetical protein